MGMQLGSPIVALNADQNTGWLHDFMTDASAPHVDFVCFDYYVPPARFGNPTQATGDLVSYINTTYGLYTKPIWIQQFNMIGTSSVPWNVPTQPQMEAFLRTCIPWLEALAALQRYSWYSIHAPVLQDQLGHSFDVLGLVREDGRMSDTGVSFFDLGSV
jgi:hypothetical protein